MSSPLKRHLVDTFSGLHCRLLDWRPDKLPDERFQSEKTVVLKNVFDPSEFDVSISPGYEVWCGMACPGLVWCFWGM